MYVRFIKFACICTHNAYLLKAEYPNCLQISYDRGMPRVVGRNAGCCKQMATWYSTLPLSCNNLSFMLREWSTTVYIHWAKDNGFFDTGQPFDIDLGTYKNCWYIHSSVQSLRFVYTADLIATCAYLNSFLRVNNIANTADLYYEYIE